MCKSNKLYIAAFVIILTIILGSSMSVFAATGCQGYAVHRDGAGVNFNWHAGIMDEPSADKYLPVTKHISIIYK